MARFDVFRLGRSGRLVLDVQADRIVKLETRVVVPLRTTSELVPITHLNPILTFQGIDYVMHTQTLAAVPRRDLGSAVGRMAEWQDEITYALDMLLIGH